jgi:hypothetical protein
MEVEAQNELEENVMLLPREASPASPPFISMKEMDDIFFNSELRNSFFSIANLYRATLN